MTELSIGEDAVSFRSPKTTDINRPNSSANTKEHTVADPQKRKLLKVMTALSAAAAVGAGGATIAAKESSIIHNEGAFTWDGTTYQAIYERHGEGIQVPINPDADILFLEYAYNPPEGTDNQFTASPETLRADSTANLGGGTVYKFAVDHHIPVAYGDILFRQSMDEMLAWLENKEQRDGFSKVIFASVAQLMPEVMRQQLNKNIIDNEKKGTSFTPLTRRSFLAKLSTTAAAAAGVLYGSWLFSGGYTASEAFNKKIIPTLENKSNLPDQYAPYMRFFIRLQGLTSHVHPEDPEVFVRNAVFALKLKQVSQYIKDSGVEHPTIPFILGAEHSGVEDFIPLPEEVLRQIIMVAGGDYLDTAIEKYGDFVATTRIVEPTEEGVFVDKTSLVDQQLFNAIYARQG